MRSWLLYFFTGFWSNRRSAECQWRSLGNTALGALLSFALLLCGLTWGYQASFKPTYQRAEQFRQFLYTTMDTVDFTVTEGKAVCSEVINTFNTRQEGYRLIVDTRDTRHIYDDFTLTCLAEDGSYISYESYLAQPAHIQQKYTEFSVAYSGKELDLQGKYPTYLEYLKTVTDLQSALYNEETAENLKKLETEKPADYYEQIYLLYVESYYPTLETAEFNAKAPTIHGYYLELMTRDTTGTFVCLLKDQCCFAFHSGRMRLVFTGDYSGIETLKAGADGADTLITKAFQSNTQTDYLMYAVNIFGGCFLIILLWLLLMVVTQFVCRFKGCAAAATFCGAAQLTGSFLLHSGGIAAVCGFLMSFFLDQAAVYYGAIGIMALTLILRTVIFITGNKEE